MWLTRSVTLGEYIMLRDVPLTGLKKGQRKPATYTRLPMYGHEMINLGFTTIDIRYFDTLLAMGYIDRVD